MLPEAGGGWAAVQGVLASKSTSYEYCGVQYWGLTDNICALDVEGRGEPGAPGAWLPPKQSEMVLTHMHNSLRRFSD